MNPRDAFIRVVSNFLLMFGSALLSIIFYHEFFIKPASEYFEKHNTIPLIYYSHEVIVKCWFIVPIFIILAVIILSFEGKEADYSRFKNIRLNFWKFWDWINNPWKKKKK